MGSRVRGVNPFINNYTLKDFLLHTLTLRMDSKWAQEDRELIQAPFRGNSWSGSQAEIPCSAGLCAPYKLRSASIIYAKPHNSSHERTCLVVADRHFYISSSPGATPMDGLVPECSAPSRKECVPYTCHAMPWQPLCVPIDGSSQLTPSVRMSGYCRTGGS